ncbi:MAG: hypothetical protein PHR45_08910 [Muribaculaceae bacterium]|nr:hypothetical protein [Muribaculaceae bacterium]
MKNYVILLVCLLGYISADAVTKGDIESMYRACNYSGVVKNADAFVNSDDVDVLLMIGGSYMNVATAMKTEATNAYNSAMMQYNMIMAMGGFADCSMSLILYQSQMQTVLNYTIKGGNFLTRAAGLGSTKALSLLSFYGLLNGSSPNSNAPSYSGGYNSNNSRLHRERCSFCNGTGVSPIANDVVAYGSTSRHWCDDCHKMVSATHGAHLRCPSCQGKGYNEHYR